MDNKKVSTGGEKSSTLEDRMKFIEYKLNLIMENTLVIGGGKKTLMDLWRERGKKDEVK